MHFKNNIMLSNEISFYLIYLKFYQLQLHYINNIDYVIHQLTDLLINNMFLLLKYIMMISLDPLYFIFS